MHTPHGQQVLSRFLHEFAGIDATWTPANIADALVEQVRNQIGDGRAICGLSGGVDSAVAAALVQRAIGDRLTCVFVDHGLLRAGERAQVQRDFVAATGANLVTVDVADRFLEALAGVTDPEGKRKIIGREFIRAFEGASRDIGGVTGDVRGRIPGAGHAVSRRGGVRWGHGHGQHQVPPQRWRAARRPEVQTRRAAAAAVQGRGAAVGRELGLPEEIVARQPFPGPGLGIRIVGEVTAAGWTRCGAPTRSPARS